MNIWSRRLFNIPHYLSGSGYGESGEGWNGSEGSNYKVPFPPNDPLPSDEFDEDNGGLVLYPIPQAEEPEEPTAIEKEIIITRGGQYYVTLVGGGGDSNSVFLSHVRYKVSGASGAAWRGLVYLEEGTYSMIRGGRNQASYLSGSNLTIIAGAGASAPQQEGLGSVHDPAGGTIYVSDPNNKIITDNLSFPEHRINGNSGHYISKQDFADDYEEWLDSSYIAGGSPVYGAGRGGGYSQSVERGSSGAAYIIDPQQLLSREIIWDSEIQDFYAIGNDGNRIWLHAAFSSYASQLYV